ncbi:MAG: hypothetical protein ACHQIM_18680 [Sphingobacteriales bacterium]
MMKNYKLIISLLFLLGSFNAIAQIDDTDEVAPQTVFLHKETKQLYPRKGKFFISWGYNRAAFSHSNMNFRGNGYNFNINDIRATDDPTRFSSVYVNPTGFTVPQFNYRVGYFLDDKTFVSIGSDHMKYTMSKQTTHLTGYINSGVNKGTYNNTEVVVGEDAEVGNSGPSIIDKLPGGFVTNFEHCDGLNDFNAEIGRLEQLWISRNHRHAFAVLGSVGLGMVIPDTDADVLGQPPKHDMEKNKKAYHLAGYSVSATMGFQFDFFNHLFLQARVKAGYMNLPDINTTTEGGKASQHFCFLEPIVALGYSFHL